MITQICQQEPNVSNNKHQILVKDLISSNFFNANNKKIKDDQTS